MIKDYAALQAAFEAHEFRCGDDLLSGSACELLRLIQHTIRMTGDVSAAVLHLQSELALVVKAVRVTKWGPSGVLSDEGTFSGTEFPHPSIDLPPSQAFSSLDISSLAFSLDTSCSARSHCYQSESASFVSQAEVI